MEKKSEHSKSPAKSPAKIPAHYWFIVTILACIAVQVVMVKIYGIKHVPIKAGYYEPMPDFETGKNDTARERLLWLESQLAPPPLLVWSDNTLPLLEYRAILPDDAEEQANNSISASFMDIPSSIPDTDLESLSSGQVIEVTAFYARELPDLRTVEANERKVIFISTVLPHILRANQELLERRRRIKIDYANDNTDRIRKWAELYGIKNAKDQNVDQLYDELMSRVDAIPVSLALAQAIVESGWGTSRFARQGNALFGEWAWSESKGIKPLSPSNDRAVVRSFVSIFDSVRSYMHNLNTHNAYQNLRIERQKYREGDQNILTQRLIPTLDKYAQDGDIYIRKLKNIVRTNNLQIYDNAVLARNN